MPFTRRNTRADENCPCFRDRLLECQINLQKCLHQPGALFCRAINRISSCAQPAYKVTPGLLFDQAFHQSVQSYFTARSRVFSPSHVVNNPSMNIPVPGRYGAVSARNSIMRAAQNVNRPEDSIQFVFDFCHFELVSRLAPRNTHRRQRRKSALTTTVSKASAQSASVVAPAWDWPPSASPL